MTASISDLPPAPPTPTQLTTLTELGRASYEFGATLASLPWLNALVPQGDGSPVLTLPGYGGADGSMAGIRAFLRACGYSAYALRAGRNLDTGAERIRSVDDATRFREKMVATVVSRVAELHERTGQKVTLVGWSLGGVYAVDAMQEKPSGVRQVVTLGSPFGDPRGTALFNVLRRLSRSTIPVEDQNFQGWLDKCMLKTTEVPVSVIYSPRDGIVSTAITRLGNDAHVRYRKVASSHIGFAFNPRAYIALAHEMAAVSA